MSVVPLLVRKGGEDLRLFVVRHGDFGPDGGEARGQALAAGRILRGLVKNDDLVALLCSPIWRARETAKIIGEEIGSLPEVSTAVLLEDEAAGLVRDQQRIGTSVLILVGHQPLLWRVSVDLGGKQGKEAAKGLFRYGSVVRVDLDNGTIQVMS